MKRFLVGTVAASIAVLLGGSISEGLARPSREAAPPAPHFQPGPVDGVVGRRTKAALAKYQQAERIQVTGRLDSETMVRLDIHQRLFRLAARRQG